MKQALAMVALLAGCVTTTLAARERRQAELLLRECVGYGPEQQPLTLEDKRRCLAESRAWCLAHDLEASCGSDELWADPDLLTPHRQIGSSIEKKDLKDHQQ